MSTYIFGDIHGCFKTFLGMLDQVQWNPQRDMIWLVGDLVNRGVQSLQMLEWVLKHQENVRCILGNHEIHLLACYAGASFSSGDTLEACLLSPQIDTIIEWLRRQPILYQEGQHAMVHAGICPLWSWAHACERANQIEEVLQSEDGLSTLAYFHPSRKKYKLAQVVETHDNLPRWVEDLGWFTRVRAVDQSHQRDERFKGSLDYMERGHQAWFDEYQKRVAQVGGVGFPSMLYFGHWAALGIYRGPYVYALDSGCVWGKVLSAVRLEDGKLFQQKTLDQSLVPKNKRIKKDYKS